MGFITLKPEEKPDYKINPPTGVVFNEAKYVEGPEPIDSPYLKSNYQKIQLQKQYYVISFVF